MSNLVLTKKSNAIFLGIVLIAGTIAALSSSSTSSFMVEIEAQTYYDDGDSNGGIDNRYDTYGQIEYSSEDTNKNRYESDYGMDDNSYDNKKSYETNSYESDYGIDNDRKSYRTDSYESTDYTDKNSYEPTVKDYRMDDNNYQKIYEKDNDNNYDKSQYQSSLSSTSDYYKPQYPSYEGKDNRDKSKDSSKSVSINKFNCINTNLNINGNNTGDINLGNKGADKGYSGGYSSNGGGYGGDEGYYDDGYDNKQSKGFDCVINNNNNNTNIIGGGGNQTIPPEPTTANLNVTKTTTCNPQEFGDFCNFNPQITVTGNNPTPSSFLANDTPIIVTLGAGLYSVSEAGFELGMQPCFGRGFDGGQQIGQNIIVCTNISDSCSEDIRAGQELSCTIENTVTRFFTSQGIADSSITSQGIADSSITSQGIADSSTVEKLAKLKAQWLDLLP